MKDVCRFVSSENEVFAVSLVMTWHDTEWNSGGMQGQANANTYLSGE